jgi:hypothetical protein
MACCAVLRSVPLPVTREARAHIVVDRTLCDRRLSQISVTSSASDPSLIMRLVTKFYMSIRRKAVDAHPRDFDFFIRIGDDLLHFRFLSRELCVTQHALSYGRNTSGRPSVSANVAIDTGEAEPYVRVVGKGNRLLCKCTDGVKRDEPHRVGEIRAQRAEHVRSI